MVKENRMKRLILVVIFLFLLSKVSIAGMLYGRIIQEDGRPLAKTRIVIEGKEVITNEFGGYAVDLCDGERELNVSINGTPYISEKINIYSPKTKQNWRIDHRKRRLIKIR